MSLGLAGSPAPFDDNAFASTSGEQLARLDLQAAAHALMPLAPMAVALISGVAATFLMTLVLSLLDRFAEWRAGHGAARRIPSRVLAARHPSPAPRGWPQAARSGRS